MDEQLNGVNEVSGETIVAPEPPKEPSPEEKEEIEKKRLQFRKLHELVAKGDLIDAEAFLGTLEGVIATSFQLLEREVKVEDLKFTVENEKLNEAICILSGLSVQEAITFPRVLFSKIQGYTKEKTKDWTVESLDIELL